MTDEMLKPCPFCGGDAVCSPCDDSGEVVFAVACMSCQAQITKCDEAGAIEQWNTRAAIEAIGASDEVRETAALAWLMAEADADAEHCKRLLRLGRNEDHYGDCTKAPITCNRCVCDEAFEAADQARAALKDEMNG